MNNFIASLFFYIERIKKYSFFYKTHSMFRFIFSVFLLFFFLFNQDDVLTYWQCVICGGYKHYVSWLIALLLTIVLTAIGGVGEHLLKKRTQHARLSYVFVGWLATSLTSIGFVSCTYQVVLAFVAIIVGVLFVIINKLCQNSSLVSERSFWQHFYPTSLQMLLLCFYVGAGNGVTDIAHYELQTAQALQSDHPKRGYKVGENSYATSNRLFAMRCYLIATTHKKGLGDKVFEQMLPEHANAETLLLPTDKKLQVLFPIENQTRLLGCARRQHEAALSYLKRCAWLSAFKNGQKRTPAIDYYLTALLLNRDLKTFAREVVSYYPTEVKRGTLPTYFAQALLLYQHTCLQPITTYNDNAIEANYQDYSEMGDSIANPTIRSNMLRNNYGETYWWWFTYAKR